MEFTFNMNMQLLDDRLEIIEIAHEELGHDVNHAIVISDNDDVSDDVGEITEQEMANDADNEDNDVELEVAVVIESSEQEEENAESGKIYVDNYKVNTLHILH
ncbi:hypothetical protein G6F68_011755 [Rhizopus microsporus]|nr:hypothetical protein G6F67_009427 [Rhizopus microsporus]KAG1252512.1 hypothetical protein G6F68_011755 [Rhizopus microsporus]